MSVQWSAEMDVGVWPCLPPCSPAPLPDHYPLHLPPTSSPPPCPPGTGNTTLAQAESELVGQKALFKEGRAQLGTLKRQSGGDRWGGGGRGGQM